MKESDCSFLRHRLVLIAGPAAWVIVMVALSLFVKVCLTGCTDASKTRDVTVSESQKGGTSPQVVGSTYPVAPTGYVNKAQIAKLHLAAYQEEFVLGEPVLLGYRAIPSAEDGKSPYSGRPQIIPLLLIVSMGGHETTYESPGAGQGRVFLPREVSSKWICFDRVDMWGQSSGNERYNPQPIFAKPGRYRLTARLINDEPTQVIESNTVEITIRPADAVESVCLDMLKGGTVLWAAFAYRAPIEADSKLIGRVAKKSRNTPYEPYVLFALAQGISEGDGLGSGEPVSDDLYQRFLVSFKAAKRLIEEYPKFCLRDDAFYLFLHSWGRMPMLEMWGVKKYTHPDPAEALPRVRERAALCENFLRDYPQSPVAPEVKTMLAQDRNYIGKHTGAAP